MKRVVSVIIGVLAGFALVYMGEATTNALNPFPRGLDYTNRNDMREYIASIPMYVKLLLIIFWLAATFLGAMLAARINRVEWKRTSLITGGILLAATLLNLARFPHPTWMWITVLIASIPLAFLGGWLIRPKTVKLPW